MRGSDTEHKALRSVSTPSQTPLLILILAKSMQPIFILDLQYGCIGPEPVVTGQCAQLRYRHVRCRWYAGTVCPGLLWCYVLTQQAVVNQWCMGEEMAQHCRLCCAGAGYAQETAWH